ncbi:MAG: FAD-dependent oxidoreductase [Candidatus Eremiobacteraeota bacterium]|nr:FAD-dependent oxidoreductase [Candidatus Eremiobacteraeota bacterium]
MERFDAVIVGAGVVGAAVAYEFASYGVDTLVLESANGPAAAVSGASAGILDTGYSTPSEGFESAMILAHGQRWPAIFEELKIPYKVCGAVLIAQDTAQIPRLAEIEQIAQTHGVKVKLFDRGQMRHLEPQAKATAGLLIPGEAITDPYEMVSRLLGSGPKIRYSSRVIAVEPASDGALVRCESGDVEARFVVNCAGLFADEIAGDSSFTLTPRRGEFAVFPEEAAMLTDHIIFPLPEESSKSAIIFPTIYGHLCAFATTGDQDDKADWKTTPEGTSFVQAAAAKLIPKLADFTPVDSWAGLRAIGHPRNYIAEWSKRVPKMFNIAAIASAGLSASFGLSAYLLDRCRERGLEVKTRSTRPTRTAEPTFPWWQRRKR